MLKVSLRQAFLERGRLALHLAGSTLLTLTMSHNVLEHVVQFSAFFIYTMCKLNGKRTGPKWRSVTAYSDNSTPVL